MALLADKKALKIEKRPFVQKKLLSNRLIL